MRKSQAFKINLRYEKSNDLDLELADSGLELTPGGKRLSLRRKISKSKTEEGGTNLTFKSNVTGLDWNDGIDDMPANPLKPATQ